MNYLEVKELFTKLFDGELSEQEGRDFLIALHEKGESTQEIQAATEVMRSHMVSLNVDSAIKEKLFDNCGTGGDKSGSFNISTTVSFILAAGGLYIAKHGNRSITSNSGSADMLEALGMNLHLPPEKISTLLEETGFAFIFAQNHHPSMKYIMPIRKTIPHKTVFNILGPLTNPAQTKKQMIGVFDKSFTEKMATVLHNTGSKKATVVSAEDGLDEISLNSISYASTITENGIKNYEIVPWDYGFEKAPLEKIRGGNAKDNAATTINLLNGFVKKAKRDIVILNAALGFETAGVARDLQDGIEIATEMIDSRKAFELLKRSVEISQKL